MRIGVLSDSHGHAAITARATARLAEAGAQSLVHLGDIGTIEVLDALALLPARVVFGNCDLNIDELARAARARGIAVDHPAGRIEIDGKLIAFTHGHYEQLMKEAIEDAVAYLLHGHTHVARDDRFGETRIINPGALHRAVRYTAALLDPGRDTVEFLEITR